MVTWNPTSRGRQRHVFAGTGTAIRRKVANFHGCVRAAITRRYGSKNESKRLEPVLCYNRFDMKLWFQTNSDNQRC